MSEASETLSTARKAVDGPFDAIILGGGPAGLAAAVYLGRYLRPTLLINARKPATRWHRPIAHNVLGYPAGIHRNQLLDWGRSHVDLYDCIQTQKATICSIRMEGPMEGEQGGSQGLFVLADTDGETYRARGLILAPGVEYELPDIPDVIAYAGHSIWHCPECDGYKTLGKKVVVIGNGRGSAEMALGLTVWSHDVTLCTNGEKPSLDEEARNKLKAAGIRTIEERITRIRGNAEEGILESFELEGGGKLDAFGAFANLPCKPPVDLFKQLPLELVKDRWIKTDHRMRTNIPRCYAAGDVVAYAQTQLSVAMGTGATAAIWLHKELLPPQLCLSEREW
jgi:thioredoxin reductase